MYKGESILENVTQKIPWDFEIQTDPPIPTWRLHLVTVNEKKRNCWIVNIVVPVGYRFKIKGSKNRDKDLDLARELRRPWNMKVTVIPIVIDAFETVPKGLGKEAWKAGDRSTNLNQPISSIAEIGHNTEKKPGELKRLTVIQTPVKYHQLTLERKTDKS